MLIERAGATAVLTMNRPDQRNALSPELREAFAQAVAQVRDDPAVKAVVLTGAGGHFCTGFDLKHKRVPGEEGALAILQDCFSLLHDGPLPSVAAIEGNAFGAGLSVALAADFVLVSQRAKFCAVFARLGYIPDMGAMYLLPRAVGLARAKDLVFSARVVDAAEAVSIGLAQQVVAGDVLQAALAYAERFHAAPTDAIGLAKGVMNHAFESDRRSVYAQEAMAQAMCRESAFHQEAARRFLAKEPAPYQWPDAPKPTT